MLYDVGTHIDLTHLNQKNERVEKPRPEPASVRYDTGTQLIFRWVNGHLITARKIQVAFA